MQTRVKVFFVTELEKLEQDINGWIAENHFDIHQILQWPIMKGTQALLMFIVIYSQEDWRK
jgi:hypothetical protein